MRRLLVLALTLGASLAAAASAQAVVVDLNPALLSGGKTPASVTFPADGADYAGLALVPGTSGDLAAAGVPVVTAGPSCSDPWLAADLWRGVQYGLPLGALCYQGGQVLHANETVDVTWDPLRRYWQDTKQYMERFLRNVADASGSLSSPFALTTQYRDGTGRAGDQSRYGGGCIDFGNPGGYTCTLGDGAGSGTGANYPNGGVGDCASMISGDSAPAMLPDGAYGSIANDVCLTNGDIRAEVASIVSSTNFEHLHLPGYTPVVDVLLPAGVEVCLDSSGSLCSANGSTKAVAARFCSYHAWTAVDGVQVPYVVQPWTSGTACDEPGAPAIPAGGSDPDAQALAADVGAELVSPLSQAQIGAITDPWLNGWFSDGGDEINDNAPVAGEPGCQPLPSGLDDVTLAGTPYVLQREFNNAGLIQSDPNSPTCALGVALNPQFVVPSPIDQGDVVAFDGSKTDSTLIVPKDDYQWSFGDGGTAIGPSVTHVYAKGGTYTVTLRVTDRGGNEASLSQTITVLGPDGQPVSGSSAGSGLHAHLLMLPQSLERMLRSGITLLVSSDERADGIVTLSIPRRAARRAGLRAGRGQAVTIGRGTVSGLRDGVVTLHLRISRPIARRLSRLHTVTVTVHMLLMAAGGNRLAIDVAGRY
jgi:hypothetical protein